METVESFVEGMGNNKKGIHMYVCSHWTKNGLQLNHKWLTMSFYCNKNIDRIF